MWWFGCTAVHKQHCHAQRCGLLWSDTLYTYLYDSPHSLQLQVFLVHYWCQDEFHSHQRILGQRSLSNDNCITLQVQIINQRVQTLPSLWWCLSCRPSIRFGSPFGIPFGTIESVVQVNVVEKMCPQCGHMHQPSRNLSFPFTWWGYHQTLVPLNLLISTDHLP